MKPQSPEVHAPLADWVRRGGVLVVVDDDADPYNSRPRMVEQQWVEITSDYSVRTPLQGTRHYR